MSKGDRIRQELEGRFELGLYSFGEILKVNDLAKEFGASRQPVMTALNELRNDGFVVITPQVGCAAATPTPSEVADFFSVFAKMDGRLAFMAARRKTPKQVEDLAGTLRDLEASPGRAKQWQAGDLGILVSQYHSIIREMANSPALAHRVARFWRMANYIIRNARQNYSEEMHAQANKERRKIFNAIAAGDDERAELLMEQHIIGKPRRVGLLHATEPQQLGVGANRRSAIRR